MKLKNLIFVIISIFAFGFTLQSMAEQKKRKTKKERTKSRKTRSNSYTLVSPFGHEFKIDVDYRVQSLNNPKSDCIAQYIITNIGNIDFDVNERFPAGKIIKNGTSFDNQYFNPKLVFEFTTVDGKKIEAYEGLYPSLLKGKSSESETVEINTGLRNCTGEVVPVRIEYQKVIP